MRPLAKAERVDNFLGLPGRTGLEMLGEFHRHQIVRLSGGVGRQPHHGNGLAAVEHPVAGGAVPPA